MSTFEVLYKFIKDAEINTSRIRKINELRDQFMEAETQQKVTAISVHNREFILANDLQRLAINARRRIARIRREKLESYKLLNN